MVRTLASLLVALVVTAFVPALAEAQNPLIERGIGEYDEVRFEEALQTLSAALVRTGNTPSEQQQIYRYLALTYLALGRQEEASGAWRALLALAPETQTGSDMSPRFRTFFDGVRTQWESDGRPGTPPARPVSIAHRSPPQADRGTQVALEATVDDPDHRTASLVLAYRQGSSAVFRRVECERGSDGTYTATIPGNDVSPPLVEYYFEAIDANGLPLASRGDVAAPLRIAVPAPGRPIEEEPAFWGILGGSAVAVGIAIGLGVFFGTQSSGGTQQGTLVITID
ncbi:MAG: tetratricopeptide repeat protein [Sandaracinus sp.]